MYFAYLISKLTWNTDVLVKPTFVYAIKNLQFFYETYMFITIFMKVSRPAILIELNPVYNIPTYFSNINLILPAYAFPASVPHAMTLTSSVI
jgi:hypothetical protein